jgi:hypothetical protein
MVMVVVVAGMFREGEGGLVEEGNKVRTSADVLPGAGIMSRHSAGWEFSDICQLVSNVTFIALCISNAWGLHLHNHSVVI